MTLTLLKTLIAFSLFAPPAHADGDHTPPELAALIATGDSAQYATLTTADHQLIQSELFPTLAPEVKKQYFLKTLLSEAKLGFKDVAAVVPYLSVSCGSLPNALKVETNPPGWGLRTSESEPTDELEHCAPLERNADGSVCYRAAVKITALQLETDFTRFLHEFQKNQDHPATAALASYAKGCQSLFPAAEEFLAKVIPNFHVEDEGAVYRGGRPKDPGVDALAAFGIRTIIDLQGGDLDSPPEVKLYVEEAEPGEQPAAIAQEQLRTVVHGMTFFNFPLNSMRVANDKEQAEILDALGIMSNPKYQPVYIHCEHGADRTGLVAALFRVGHDKWTPQAAHDEMVADGHSGFFDHLVTGAMDETFDKMALKIKPGQY